MKRLINKIRRALGLRVHTKKLKCTVCGETRQNKFSGTRRSKCTNCVNAEVRLRNRLKKEAVRLASIESGNTDA